MHHLAVGQQPSEPSSGVRPPRLGRRPLTWRVTRWLLSLLVRHVGPPIGTFVHDASPHRRTTTNIGRASCNI